MIVSQSSMDGTHMSPASSHVHAISTVGFVCIFRDRYSNAFVTIQNRSSVIKVMLNTDKNKKKVLVHTSQRCPCPSLITSKKVNSRRGSVSLCQRIYQSVCPNYPRVEIAKSNWLENSKLLTILLVSSK